METLNFENLRTWIIEFTEYCDFYDDTNTFTYIIPELNTMVYVAITGDENLETVSFINKDTNDLIYEISANGNFYIGNKEEFLKLSEFFVTKRDEFNKIFFD